MPLFAIYWYSVGVVGFGFVLLPIASFCFLRFGYNLSRVDGSREEGEFREGETDGQGVETWPDGSRYEDEFREGGTDGQGVLTFADGCRYEGETREGKYHGQGVLTWPEGSRYEGEFREGKPHGQGVYTFTDGSREYGEFRERERHGQDVMTETDGSRYEGGWHEGQFHALDCGAPYRAAQSLAALDSPAAAGFEPGFAAVYQGAGPAVAAGGPVAAAHRGIYSPGWNAGSSTAPRSATKSGPPPATCARAGAGSGCT